MTNSNTKLVCDEIRTKYSQKKYLCAPAKPRPYLFIVIMPPISHGQYLLIFVTKVNIIGSSYLNINNFI